MKGQSVGDNFGSRQYFILLRKRAQRQMSARSHTLSLYRQLLRTALKMPDDHRTQLVVFRARQAKHTYTRMHHRVRAQLTTTSVCRTEFERHRNLPLDSQEQRTKWLDAEIYIDQLQVRANKKHNTKRPTSSLHVHLLWPLLILVFIYFSSRQSTSPL